MKTLAVVMAVIVVGALAFGIGIKQATSTASPGDLPEILSGKTYPLTFKLKQLDGSWRRLGISGPATQVAGVSNVYYTKGQMVTLNGEKYLVTYRVDTPLTSVWQAMGAALGDGDKLTPDTLLSMTLVNVKSINGYYDVTPFDMQREIKLSQSD